MQRGTGPWHFRHHLQRLQLRFWDTHPIVAQAGGHWGYFTIVQAWLSLTDNQKPDNQTKAKTG